MRLSQSSSVVQLCYPSPVKVHISYSPGKLQCRMLGKEKRNKTGNKCCLSSVRGEQDLVLLRVPGHPQSTVPSRDSFRGATNLWNSISSMAESTSPAFRVFLFPFMAKLFALGRTKKRGNWELLAIPSYLVNSYTTLKSHLLNI